MGRSAEDDVLLSTTRLVMAVSVRAADHVGDVSPVQLRALTVLRRRPAANLVQLTEAMGVTVSTASRLVDRLVAAGLVDRRPSAVTGREISLTLTPVGTQTLDRYDALRVRGMREQVDAVPPELRRSVVAALASLLTGSGGDEPTGPQES